MLGVGVFSPANVTVLHKQLPSAKDYNRTMKKGVTHMAEKNNQFKENTNHGEHRNGRKSQYKNHNAKGGRPNEFISDKEE